jgi:hypothetical protein
MLWTAGCLHLTYRPQKPRLSRIHNRDIIEIATP